MSFQSLEMNKSGDEVAELILQALAKQTASAATASAGKLPRQSRMVIPPERRSSPNASVEFSG